MTLLEYANHSEALPRYFDYFFNRLEVGTVACISGSQRLKTGCGKSWTALKLGETIDPNFSIDNVVYHPSEFLKVMDRIEENGKSGQVVVIDEGEITAPANLYFAFTNKAISYNLATFRYLRCMAIFVTPSFSWLDKRVRTLTNFFGYTEKHFGNWRTKKESAFVRLKLYNIETDPLGDKIYRKRITMYNTTIKRPTTFSYFDVEPISDELAEGYEAKSRLFKKNLRKGLLQEMARFEKYEEGGAGSKVPLQKLAEEALKNDFVRADLQEKNRVSGSTLAAALESYELDNWRASEVK